MIRPFLLSLLLLGAASAAPLALESLTPAQRHILGITDTAHITVIVIAADWCPPCRETLTLLGDLKREYPALQTATLFLDRPTPDESALARRLGLDAHIPLTLVTDASGIVVKRFHERPGRTLLFDLLRRLFQGRLENGTLPPEERIDLWKKERRGMRG